MNIPSIRKSPWAKLMMFITPQMRVSPMATREYTDPISRLFTICCISWSAIMSPFAPPLGGGAEPAPPPGPRLLPRLPVRERPNDVLGGRLERPDSGVLLVLDLHQGPGGVDILLALGVELHALPRIEHLIAGDVGRLERLDDGLGIRALGPVDGI